MHPTPAPVPASAVLPAEMKLAVAKEFLERIGMTVTSKDGRLIVVPVAR